MVTSIIRYDRNVRAYTIVAPPVMKSVQVSGSLNKSMKVQIKHTHTSLYPHTTTALDKAVELIADLLFAIHI